MRKSGNSVLLAATDLANHLACRHLTVLNRQAALGEIERSYRRDAILETLIERGLAHEKAYVDYLRSQGKTVVEIEFGDKTLTAVRDGVDVRRL